MHGFSLLESTAFTSAPSLKQFRCFEHFRFFAGVFICGVRSDSIPHATIKGVQLSAFQPGFAPVRRATHVTSASRAIKGVAELLNWPSPLGHFSTERQNQRHVALVARIEATQISEPREVEPVFTARRF